MSNIPSVLQIEKSTCVDTIDVEASFLNTEIETVVREAAG